ncbi:polysaccharide deacetylase family protein [Tissierella pigra]|uniref:Polysaccharide deacetylase family protein n=1 Tax=Tissierella pigra TaxID=2607614 RepID=A0A6N7XU07_9FIRM|nr:polysaccharide deacetylase family protein [Tissierella pigra]MBU5426580.1 polysaccharide deacetylase family protein [Tissierella pigra]MST99974.1 polysaccharide deacetylase family protein [Tissierella pigra]
MRLFIISKKSLLTISILLLVVIISLIIFKVYNKSEETFNSDVYYQGNVDDKVVAFACNVDWGNEYIPEMLKIFEENNIKITYFVTGKWAEKNKEILKDIYNAKHEIGNHGYSHIDYDKLNYDRNREEIQKAHDIIKDILGIDSKYFGPPSGAYNDNTVKAVKDLGYELIMWSVDTIDWREDSTKDIIFKRVTQKIHNSAIVLMHPTSETVKALPDIINYLYENGYNIGTISDVIKN